MDTIEPIARWIHIIAGITWIGLLYFFNFINGHLAATYDADSKKKVVPELMPRALYWFRWGAAWTWVSGIILIGLVFYVGNMKAGDDLSGAMAETEEVVVIDDSGNTEKVDSESWEATEYDDTEKGCFTNGAIDKSINKETCESLGDKAEWVEDADIVSGKIDIWVYLCYGITFLAFILYDFIYKSSVGKNTRVATLISFGLVAAFIYFMSHFANFSYRAYNIHIGAMFGTIMAFNVWFRIWPAQQRIISAIKEGVAPNASDVGLAGLRSKHNTYMSIPLIWTMINYHTAGGGFNKIVISENYVIPGEISLLFFIALGWHIVFQLYRKSGKVKGF